MLHSNANGIIDHMDGDAQATNTDELEDALWYVEPLSVSEQHVQLMLPTSMPTTQLCGFSEGIKTHGTSGSQFVRCFYAPSLPVTIIYPNAMGMRAGCNGYSSYSNFGRALAMRSSSIYIIAIGMMKILLWFHSRVFEDYSLLNHCSC